MVYTPGTAYGTQIQSLLGGKNIQIAGQPVCESASADALLAQVRVGRGAA